MGVSRLRSTFSTARSRSSIIESERRRSALGRSGGQAVNRRSTGSSIIVVAIAIQSRSLTLNHFTTFVLWQAARAKSTIRFAIVWRINDIYTNVKLANVHGKHDMIGGIVET
jgi:hypothetical protein